MWDHPEQKSYQAQNASKCSVGFISISDEASDEMGEGFVPRVNSCILLGSPHLIRSLDHGELYPEDGEDGEAGR